MPEEEELKSSGNDERGSGKGILVLVLLLLLVVGAVYYIFTRNSSVQNAFHSIQESTQDAATTSRVRTALLLSKQVSTEARRSPASRPTASNLLHLPELLFQATGLTSPHFKITSTCGSKTFKWLASSLAENPVGSS